MDIREKIAQIINTRTKVHHHVDGSSITGEEIAEEIHTIIKEAGYVKLPESVEITELAETLFNFPTSIRSIKANIQSFLLANHYVQLSTIISELEKDFELAPNNASYLRILVSDTLAYLKTGKRRKQRADEAGEARQKVVLKEESR